MVLFWITKFEIFGIFISCACTDVIPRWNLMQTVLQKLCQFYLTVSRWKGGDYKHILTKAQSGKKLIYELEITEPEATNCFSIHLQVNIMSLSRKFCV